MLANSDGQRDVDENRAVRASYAAVQATAGISASTCHIEPDSDRTLIYSSTATLSASELGKQPSSPHDLRVALVAPPFIPVPPRKYGGTELFIAQLATELHQAGAKVIVYANGESDLGEIEVRSKYPKSAWPLYGTTDEVLKNLDNTAWAIRDALTCCDIIHLNDAVGLAFEPFTNVPFVYTMHHPHIPVLTEHYQEFPRVNFVTISDFQRAREPLPRIRTIHHGLNFSTYRLQVQKSNYLSFLGRIAPCKGTDLAIAIAKKVGIPLKIAGDVQPLNQDYFDQEIKPHLDGEFIQYLGEADLPAKNELLGNSAAMLFPITWDEPFGLVMIEAMACGTPVLGLARGSVPEIVKPGVSGYVCQSLEELVASIQCLGKLSPARIRSYVEEHFSVARMTRQYLEIYHSALVRSERDHTHAPAVI